MTRVIFQLNDKYFKNDHKKLAISKRGLNLMKRKGKKPGHKNGISKISMPFFVQNMIYFLQKVTKQKNL